MELAVASTARCRKRARARARFALYGDIKREAATTTLMC